MDNRKDPTYTQRRTRAHEQTSTRSNSSARARATQQTRSPRGSSSLLHTPLFRFIVLPLCAGVLVVTAGLLIATLTGFV